MALEIDIYSADLSTELPLPFADGGIQAGFPSPAEDIITENLDLNRLLIRHPAATFYGRVWGDSMIDEGIHPGDIIVIDRSIEPTNGCLALCCVDHEFTLKRIRFEKNLVWLIPANEMFDPILVTPDQEFEVWGVITYSIINHQRRR
ncbi:MAG: translesion error-prone DNA polymerase V autoproteolytic subunit [Muribaculaceae bacterium]|nr:translesion error-prone DNA polymerase V autoproteolytic subunit [Muribaculaceae bacterium]